ncbi:MAG: hypothetical protein M0R51_02150 [Clostridia bacterium]|jgi:hypothetical protein|nr:hypothetical protein [Clostridia bacterium]
MEELLEKYKNRLHILKENRRITYDENTDAENELYDKLTKQCAEFCQDINKIIKVDKK